MRQAAAFVVLTFAISWSAWGLAILTGSTWEGWRALGTFGPSLAALILALRGGREEVRRLLSGFRKWRVSPSIYVFALGSTAVVGVAALGVETLIGGSPAWPAPGSLVLAPLIFVWVLLFSVAGEETGWRGYLLPRLLDRMGALQASLWLGLVWGLWHLPLWALPGDFHAAIPVSLFMAQIMGLSVLFTWLWIRSGGSLVVAHLFHAASNTTLGLLPLIPGAGAETLRPLWIAVALLWLAVALVLRGLSRSPRAPG